MPEREFLKKSVQIQRRVLKYSVECYFFISRESGQYKYGSKTSFLVAV
jgi:hypothetical protein